MSLPKRIEEARFDHNGRPIRVLWESTPALYSAIFENEYDGAPDSNCPMGFGREMPEAVADLIEQDEEREPSRPATYGSEG